MAREITLAEARQIAINQLLEAETRRIGANRRDPDQMLEQDEPGQPSDYSQEWERFVEALSNMIDSLQETARKPGFQLSNVDIVVEKLQEALDLMVENY
jgi:hypothetical protein